MSSYLSLGKQLTKLAQQYAKQASQDNREYFPPISPSTLGSNAPDIGSVRGQRKAKLALLIAAAGRHNLLLIGPPGEGKSFLASTLQGITPELDLNDDWPSVEGNYLAAGQSYSRPISQHPAKPPRSNSNGIGWLASLFSSRESNRGLEPLLIRPYRAVGPTVTSASLIGGGRGEPIPGEFPLAHNGTIYFDELPQFNRGLIDSLRQPLQDGYTLITRNGTTHSFPSDVQLLASCNPCQCGYWNPNPSLSRCRCSPNAVARYQQRISGPILDRIDMFCWLSPLTMSERLAGKIDNQSAQYRFAAYRAWLRQYRRNGRGANGKPRLNSDLGTNDITGSFPAISFTPKAESFFRQYCQANRLSTRRFVLLARLSRTVADLDTAEHNRIRTNHIQVASEFINNPFNRNS